MDYILCFLFGGFLGVLVMCLMQMARPDRIDPRSFDPEGVTFFQRTV